MRGAILIGVLLVSASFAATTAADVDSCVAHKDFSLDDFVNNLGPGDYTVEFVATEGDQEGHRVRGSLTLRPTSPEDKSPETGETADDHDIDETPLYGWLDIDLSVVGAPICETDRSPNTAPESRDPIYPGVLVHLFDPGLFQELPRGAPTLTVATVSNLRNGETWTDGCGIAMWVQVARDGTFFGQWGEWGVVRNGRGHFCIYTN